MVEVVLDPKLAEETTREGRFFEDQTDSQLGFYETSLSFWLTHEDLLTEPGRVGQVVSIDTPDDPIFAGLSLSFDAGAHMSSTYGWQLIKRYRRQPPDTSKSLDVYQIVSCPTGTVLRRFVMDVQGRIDPVPEVNDDDRLTILADISRLIREPETRQRVESLRARQTQAERDLADFAVNGILQLGRGKYDRDLATKKRLRDNIGFTALGFLST